MLSTPLAFYGESTSHRWIPIRKLILFVSIKTLHLFCRLNISNLVNDHIHSSETIIAKYKCCLNSLFIIFIIASWNNSPTFVFWKLYLLVWMNQDNTMKCPVSVKTLIGIRNLRQFAAYCVTQLCLLVHNKEINQSQHFTSQLKRFCRFRYNETRSCH